MTQTQLDEVGNTEMLNWAIMFGAIGRREGELIDYIPTWHHGLCMMRFLPGAGAKDSAHSRGAAVWRIQVPERGVPVLQAPACRSVRVEPPALSSPVTAPICGTGSSPILMAWPRNTSCSRNSAKQPRS